MTGISASIQFIAQNRVVRKFEGLSTNHARRRSRTAKATIMPAISNASAFCTTFTLPRLKMCNIANTRMIEAAVSDLGVNVKTYQSRSDHQSARVEASRGKY